MAEPGGFPVSHTTKVTSTTTVTSPTIRFDNSYLRTIPGLLKAAQILIAIIGFICVASAGYWHSRANWYSFVSMSTFWTTLILLVLYLFHFVEKLSLIPWLMLEFGYCAAFSFFYMVAALVMVTCQSCYGVSEAWTAASVFAFVNMFLFGGDAFMKFKGWRSGALAQGERTVTTSQTTSPDVPPASYPAY